MNLYRKGRAFEQEVSRYLRRKGIWVIRSAGSKGAADLVAWYGGRRALLQCKAGSEPHRRELDTLKRMARDMGATAWVIKPPRGEPRAYLVYPDQLMGTLTTLEDLATWLLEGPGRAHVLRAIVGLEASPSSQSPPP